MSTSKAGDETPPLVLFVFDPTLVNETGRSITTISGKVGLSMYCYIVYTPPIEDGQGALSGRFGELSKEGVRFFLEDLKRVCVRYSPTTFCEGTNGFTIIEHLD